MGRLANQAGITMEEIFSLCKSVEQVHRVLVFITLSSGPLDGPAGFTTISAMEVNDEDGVSILGRCVVALSAEWPCKDHRDYVSCVYNGLMTLDTNLGRIRWTQSKLEITE